MNYIIPQQKRARDSESIFLAAMEALIVESGYNACTIDEVAERAFRHRGAFLKRFGSKQGAMRVLFDRFMEDALQACVELREDFLETAPRGTTADLLALSRKVETVLARNPAVVRALPEILPLERYFRIGMARLVVRTAKTVMASGRRYRASPPRTRSVLLACQLVFTLNHSYRMTGLTALPKSEMERHEFISASARLCL